MVEFSIPERHKLKAITIPRAYVVSCTEKGARSKWGLTSKVQTQALLKGKIATSGGLVIEM